MAESQRVLLVASDKKPIAELSIADEDEGWFTGRVIWQQFPSELQAKLTWYDEVLRDQMLSFLDEATAAVQSFGLHAIFPDGSTQNTYSLHISPSADVSFRISPVAPPPESTTVILSQS